MTTTIDPVTRTLFKEASDFFPNPIGELVYMEKYSRWRDDLGRREVWPETVQRAVDYLRELSEDRLEDEDYEEIHQAILRMEVLPSMRLLAMAGAPARRSHITLYNCFTGDTPFVTFDGIQTLEQAVGMDVRVMALDGAWRQAKVQSFGKQPINRVTLRHWNGGKSGSKEHIVYVTPNHRWLLQGNRGTTDLQAGDKLDSPSFAWTAETVSDPEAVKHGFTFGDGTLSRANGKTYAMVRLCHGKAEIRETVFAGEKFSYPPSYNGDPVVYLGHDRSFFKSLPTRTDAPYVKGFIEGLAMADGSKTVAGNVRIDTQNAECAEWIERHAALAGYKVLSHVTNDLPTNYGKRSAPLHQILLGTGFSGIFRVESIEPAGEADVYCVVEPETHSFVLGNGQVTGNCSYLPVDSLDAFVEALIISMSGTGLGYSVERKYTDKLPVVTPQYELDPVRWVVGDSAEGWADALRTGLGAWFNGFDVVFDYSLVRPAGAVLKTKGGRASGPDPLRRMLDFARSTILARQGAHLSSLDCHDIMGNIAMGAVSGGHRRSAMIALYSWDDQEMRHCKDGEFWTTAPWRTTANNSAVLDDPEMGDDEIRDHFRSMVAGGNGEPGMFSRVAARDLRPARREDAEFGTNPCGEIALRAMEFCNLSEVILKPDDTVATILRKTRLATIIGTIQSMATNFPGLRPQWKENAEKERLLGVGYTGQMDCPAFQRMEMMVGCRHHARTINELYAGVLGINPSASITCVKPSGSTSLLTDSSSGLHTRWAPYYERNIRVMATGPIAKALLMQDAPMNPENGQEWGTADTYVVSFPMKAPEGAKTRGDRSAIEQMEYWLQCKRFLTEHNPSVTITYKPHEIQEVEDWVVAHRSELGGMCWLPHYDEDITLRQMPNREITKEEYERQLADFPAIDFSLVTLFEDQDQTTSAQELSCSAGLCEV